MASETTPPAQVPAATSEEPETSMEAEAQDVEAGAEALINLTIVLPDANDSKMQIMVSSQEQVHEIRQSIIDSPSAFQYTCFHLEFNGEKINDFIPLAEIPELGTTPEFHIVQDPYTEKEARIHFIRIRELIGASGDRCDTAQGLLPGLSLFETVAAEAQSSDEESSEESPIQNYDFQAVPSLTELIPPTSEPAPKTVKQISLSSWNPPPPHLRQRGHLLYLVVSTNEGEQYQITSHVSGFYVNKSSNAKFDPFPRPAPKGQSAHSLLSLIELVSPSFVESFTKLQDHNNQKDPLATFQITNAIPAAPWVVPSPNSSLCAHLPDPARSQETYLLNGVENTDTLRDWNEEFQSAKELPRETVQDRVFRERLISKLFADYNEAATRGAVMVARGEIAPLNPTECRDAQIFVYNNIFFSFGADGVGTFTSEGGDEAARVATGKDVAGVKLVNQLDIEGLFTPATVVVDYLGSRIVGQSIVPGIFKQREPGENQIDYGAVDGKDTVAADERFAPGFAQLSKALKVKKHPVWDKDGKRFDLEASVETKGLLGTDARKYVLDLYRISPLDIAWLDEDGLPEDGDAYPHRMTVLRPELVDSFSRYRLKQWIDKEVARRGELKKEKEGEKPEGEKVEEDKKTGEGEQTAESEGNEVSKEDENQPNLADFKFALNPDAFSGQSPQTDEEKAEFAADEEEVRAAGIYLREQVIPDLLKELSDSEISFPMDGQSLSRLLHKRGINVRYLGKVAELSGDGRLRCLREICVQDMVARAFKHISAVYLRHLPVPAVPAAVSHLLNCLLGHRFNDKPVAELDSDIRSLYTDADWSFTQVTPESLRTNIEEQILQRFRYELDDEWHNVVRPVQLLREVSLKLGIQLQAKDYTFTADPAAATSAPTKTEKSVVNGQTNGESGSSKKKRKNKTRETSSPEAVVPANIHTFNPDDIVDLVPLIKDSCPRSALAEEALEAGRISLMQNQKKLGQELLLESLSLHEQIYGILHPEVARVYNSLSMLYYQLDEKEAAVDLARKAIIVAERTVGVDSAETLLNYLNLSLFLHQIGDSKGALVYSKHALKMWKVIYGPDHPDSITTLNNAAVMLQHLKAYHESRLWFEESLRVCESVFGKQSINTATLLFQLAQALALDREAKAAVTRMRESYNVFLAELGPDDKNTKEAESWLEQLTQNAVNIAKHAKDVAARRLRTGIRFNTNASNPGVPSGVVPGHAGPGSQVDSRSIDELIKFIEGDEHQQSKKRTGRGNPKRRGQAGAR
ncbi:Intracellular distribution of mitochondria [Fusarium irregulare]|uniref:Clustered mitochondria protein homolog n=1 Tax=Fusarium irregulare TaxID=2494466 RepID=A0A9W8UCS8_9HYPO|nr:Intracellular distribution of mitochondria [Fusarium irregulare]KAJ4021728.1 Intracellular distribution of mitochondria [Fusarium irregulare]